MVKTCNAVALNEKNKREGERKDPELGAMEKKWGKSDLRKNKSEGA